MADPKQPQQQPIAKGAAAPKVTTGTGFASRPLREGAAAPKVNVDLTGVPTTATPLSGVSKPPQ